MSDNQAKPEGDGQKFDMNSFYIKVPDMPLIGSAEAQKSEQELLAGLKLRGPRADTLKPLAVFYSRVAQQEKAYSYLKLWMRRAKNNEEFAECLLMCGQLAEQTGQLKNAASFYREGLKYQPKETQLNYYLNNNLGYCLNVQAEYKLSMQYCEAAIGFDPSRPNAVKNLGISLIGLKKYVEAARILFKATHIDASDQRSLELMEKLLADHSAVLLAEIPDFNEQLEACRQAAATAQKGRFADWARGLTLN